MPPPAQQPMPVPNSYPSVQSMVRVDLLHAALPESAPEVIEDLIDREQLGIDRYGTPLQPFNGRDALRDAYEEALDLPCYLRQALAEEGSPELVQPYHLSLVLACMLKQELLDRHAEGR